MVVTFAFAGSAMAAVPAWNLGNTGPANIYNLNAAGSGVMHNLGTGKCVDDYAYKTAAGSAVASYTCNGATNQNWTYTPNEEYGYSDLGQTGTLKLNNAPSMCLSVPDPKGDGSGVVKGSVVELDPCKTDAKNQQWLIQFASNGSTRVEEPTGSVCLDTPGGSTKDGVQLQLYTCNGTPAQWFTPPSASLPPTGTVSDPTLGKCLTDPANNLTAGTLLQSSACVGGDGSQLWTLNQDGSLSHGLQCLDVVGGETATARGTQVDLAACNGGLDQQWIVGLDSSDRTTLVNPNSGRCLDIPSSSAKDGTVLQIWDCNNTGAQVWNAPQYAHASLVGPTVAPPSVTPPPTGDDRGSRLDAMQQAQNIREAQTRMAEAMHAGGLQMKTDADAALAGSTDDLLKTWQTWRSDAFTDDPNSAISKDRAATKIADQNRAQRDEGRHHLLDGFSMYPTEPDPIGDAVNYMSSDSTFWQEVNSTAFALPLPKADQAARDKVNAIAQANAASGDPDTAWLWPIYAQETLDGSADDARRFIEFNGIPTVEPDKDTPEFRIEVEALKTRWASGDYTNPLDPNYVMLDVEETAWTEYQQEINSQAQQRADITTAERRGLESLRTSVETMNDGLSYAWYAGQLLWAQQNRDPKNWPGAPTAEIPHDLGMIKAKVAGLSSAADMAAGQAQDAANQAQTAEDSAIQMAEANGYPEGRGLTYALQSAQVTKAAAAAAQADANALHTAVAATNATLSDSNTLFATASAQAHAAQAQFLRESAQGDAKLAATLAASAQTQATSAANYAQAAATAKDKAQAAESNAETSAAAAHQDAADAAQARQQAAADRATADAQRAKAQQDEADAQQQSSTAQSLDATAQAAASTAADRDAAAQAAESTASTARDNAWTAAQNRDALDAKADAADAAAAAAVGTADAGAARAAADEADAAAQGARSAADKASADADSATVAAHSARAAANAADEAAARAKKAAAKADSDAAATHAAALQAHAAAADAIADANKSAAAAADAQQSADQAKATAKDARSKADGAQTQATAAIADAAVAAGQASATAAAAEQASAAAGTVAGPANQSINLAAPYAASDSAAGLSTLASEAAKTVAQQQADVAQAQAAQAAKAATDAQTAADKATGDAKLAAQAAADAAKSAAAAAQSAAAAMKSAAAAAADSATAVKAAAHSDQLDQQAQVDDAAANDSATAAASDASAANAAATSAETDATGAHQAANTAQAAADSAQQASNAADTSAQQAEQAAAKAQQDAADALAAANRAGFESSSDNGWCAPGSSNVCASSTHTGTPGSNDCTAGWAQYGCDMAASLNGNWQAAFTTKFGDCLHAQFGDLDCQAAMFMQSAVIAAAKAGVDPRLVLSIALMESRKEQTIIKVGSLNGAWDSTGVAAYLAYESEAAGLSLDHNWPSDGGVASLGVTNIRPDTYSLLQSTYSQVFSGYQWQNLADHTDLDMDATAYYVKYLESTEIPKVSKAAHDKYTPEEIIYGLYNGGIGSGSASYQVYSSTGHFGNQVTANIDTWEQYWNQSNDMICGSGVLACSWH
ncbi:RICIN domain-containing protein [Streptomyces sp. NPDC001269]